MKKLLPLLFTSLLSTSAVAEPSQIRPLISLGYDFGGETIGTIIYENDDEEKISGNEGAHIAAGFSLTLAKGLDLQTLIGFQTASANGSNGELSWRSTPWETSLIAHLGNIDIGGGVIYHMNPRFKSSGVVSDLGDHDFEDAMGFQTQIAWSPNATLRGNRYSIGLRYSVVEFELEEDNSKKLDGDSTGLFFRYKF